MQDIMAVKVEKDFIRMNRLLLFVFSLSMLSQACKKSNTNSATTTDFFTPVHVNTQVDMSFAQYMALNQLQGYVYLSGVGNKGIVVYHTIEDQYVAFDRTCPVNATQTCAYVSVDSVPTRYRCGQHTASGWVKCCNSTFDATYGSPIAGEAKQGLKQYYTAKSGTVIYISSTPL
jgi:hypothetical protein